MLTEGSIRSLHVGKTHAIIKTRDDPPQLRARPTWISSEVSGSGMQNEINVVAEGGAAADFLCGVGRAKDADICLRLKAISEHHCSLGYNQVKGWTISEAKNNKESANGTFLFLKNLKQLQEKTPSDFVELVHGQIISFINYEIRVSLVQKTNEELQ